MDSAVQISYKREHFSCKQTIKGILGKLVKNRKLNYAHVRKSLSIASPKELVLALNKMKLRTTIDNKKLC